MTKSQLATADVFLMALKAMRKAERDAVVVRIARDREFEEDLLDLAVIEQRRREFARPFREFLADRNAQMSTASDHAL